MYEQGFFNDNDLMTNTEKRVPVCLCLDVSGSMSGCIEQLNDSVELFYNSIRRDSKAALACEIAIVTFETTAKLVEDFGPVEEKSRPHFRPGGGTDMGGGLTIALDLLEKRKQKYKDFAVPYYQPWLVVMSDGYPSKTQELQSNTEKIGRMERERKLKVFSIGIGSGFDASELQKLSLDPVITLDDNGTDFSRFFKWLSQSVASVSTTGGNIPKWTQ